MLKTVPQDSVLLRACTAPLQLIAENGSPELLARIREFDRREREHGEQASRLAGALGGVINGQAWSRGETKLLGALSKRIARLGVLQPRDIDALALLQSRHAELAGSIAAFFTAGEEIEQLKAAVETGAADASSHSGYKLWQACRDLPVMTALLDHRDADFLRDCRRSGGGRDFWSGKKGRQRRQYLADIIRRAAFRTIPRDWHTVVSFVPIADHEAAGPAAGESDYRVVWSENIHTRRRVTSQSWTPEREDCPLTLSPLSWQDGDRICFCVSDWLNPSKVEEVDLKASPFFRRIYDSLSGKVRSLADLRNVLENDLTAEELAIVPGFLQHLISLGVVQACPDPKSATTSGRRPEKLAVPACLRDREGFTDVYRTGRGTVSADRIRGLQKGMRLMARLSLLLDQAAAVPHPNRAGRSIGTNVRKAPVKLLDAVRERLLESHEAPVRLAAEGTAGQGDGVTEPAPRVSGRWRPADSRAAGYRRLHEWIKARLAHGKPIRLGQAELEVFEAPEWDYPWPCDAMIRLAGPGAGFNGVFDESFAAGSMDARFLAYPQGRSGAYRNPFDYRTFLAEVSRRTGVEFVELLFPPLSAGAANAVRRPDYGLRWTGDPAVGNYLSWDGPSREFVGLDRFELMPTALGQRLLVDGRPAIAMYHATRLPIPPWNVVTEKLLDAAPGNVRFTVAGMQRLLDAFPGETHAPRLEVDGGLVVACEQWRIGPEELWHEQDTKLDKLKGLSRLRPAFGLPRFVFLSPGPCRKPAAVDLEDPDCIATIEESYATGTDPLFIAQTPDAEQAWLSEDTYSFASCAQLRLPLDLSPQAHAERVSPLVARLMDEALACPPRARAS
ncbi:MAG: hypothetical protein Tsb0019_22020 [Roseibium sp.]